MLIDFDTELSEDIFYSTFRKQKRPGEYREICAPSDKLKEYQKEVQEILELYPIHENAVGFKRNMHLIDGPAMHQNKQAICNMDIENFFPSITFELFEKCVEEDIVLKDIIKDNMGLIRKIAFKDGKLPQGSPASPVISNIILKQFDKSMIRCLNRLNKRVKNIDLTYSRYADDVTVTSCDANFDLNQIANLIRYEISQMEGLKIKEHKTLIGSRELKVTGIPINKYEIPDKHNGLHIYFELSNNKFFNLKIDSDRKNRKEGFIVKGKDIGFARVNRKFRQECRDLIIAYQKQRTKRDYKNIQRIGGKIAHILNINPYYAYNFLKITIETFMELLRERNPLCRSFYFMILKKIVEALLNNSWIKFSSNLSILDDDGIKEYGKSKCIKLLYIFHDINSNIKGDRFMDIIYYRLNSIS